MAPTAPHFLRFAQALALVSGVVVPGCASHHLRDAPSDAAVPDTRIVDAGRDTPPVRMCDCECVFGGDMPDPPGSCAALGMAAPCCYLVGPLAPPELAS